VQTGDLIDVDIEKPVAGGRMLSRHDGQVVFVAGAIPGERVRARVSRVTRHALYAEVEAVLAPSADRRPTEGDRRCGGNVLGHIEPRRQVRLKGEIVADALRRLARLTLPEPPQVVASPERGYRMRARVHVRDGRVGFLREGSHELCGVEATGQLLAETVDWLGGVEDALRGIGAHAVQSIEIAENVPASERACHLEVAPGGDVQPLATLAPGLVGLTAQAGAELTALSGKAVVTDRLAVARGQTTATVTLGRDVRAFFQGNRHLLEPLVNYVAGLVPDGPVLDLYAGVGLFGLSLAALGHQTVTLVEGDRVSGASLVENAVPFAAGIQVRRMSVEHFLQADRGGAGETAIADPPRTGFSPEALRSLIRRAPGRLVYVSCDVATLARDTKIIVEAGYRLDELRAYDLFPNPAPVESGALDPRRPPRRSRVGSGAEDT
jgi:23S rRNA (uracil1939-C5)-methyltransferase